MYLNDITFILLTEAVKQILFLPFEMAWEVIGNILSQISLM